MVNTPLTAHMVVRNEDRFIWYAINSILPYVEKIIITDTGSTDMTMKIIKSIKSDKITLKSVKIKSVEEISAIRNDQISITATNWFWIVDGDEIYTNKLCEEVIMMLKTTGNKYEGIVIGRYDLIGDIYHYQTESVGAYDLFERKGHIVLRLINKAKIPGLHVQGVYPYEGYYDEDGIEIIHHNKLRFRITQGKMFHAMYLPRSTRGAVLFDTYHRNKWKIEKGIPKWESIPIPEVFYKTHPFFGKVILKKRSVIYELLASLFTPVKLLKRKLWKHFSK